MSMAMLAATRLRVPWSSSKPSYILDSQLGIFDVGHLGHFGQLFEIGYRQDAGNDFNVDAHHHATVAEAQIAFHVEEELGNNVVCTRINFAFQIDQVGLGGFGFRVNLRIAATEISKSATERNSLTKSSA